jgi:hypothetical protein
MLDNLVPISRGQIRLVTVGVSASRPWLWDHNTRGCGKYISGVVKMKDL